MNKLDLTVIIPSLNSASTIGPTLLSLEPLRRVGCRIILVDSGSQDRTAKYARGHVDEILYESPGNMYAAINKGILASRTEWVTYLNSDDLIYSDAVISALGCLAQEADIIYGNIDYIDSVGRFLYCWRSVGESSLKQAFSLGFSAIPQPGALFRKKLWADLSGFDTSFRYSSDSDFFLRAFVKGYRYRKISGPQVAAFRVHSGQLSQRFAKEMRHERQRSWVRNELRVNWLARCLWVWQFRLSNWNHFFLRYLRYRTVKN